MAGVVDGLEWARSGVYGLNADSLRGFLWDELIEVRVAWDVSWCCLGGF